MRGKNFRGASLADCSVRSVKQNTLFAMMSALPANELAERINNIKDPDVKILAQAHADALSATEDWTGPIRT